MAYHSRSLIALTPFALQVLLISLMAAMLKSEARPFSQARPFSLITRQLHMEVRVWKEEAFAASQAK